jgi:hypothetical protein
MTAASGIVIKTLQKAPSSLPAAFAVVAVAKQLGLTVNFEQTLPNSSSSSSSSSAADPSVSVVVLSDSKEKYVVQYRSLHLFNAFSHSLLFLSTKTPQNANNVLDI